MDAVLLRCQSCGSVNRVVAGRLSSGPRCGKCGAAITFPGRAVEVTAATFQKEVLSEPGAVLVNFWTPT
jgi:thioredoxin 2